MPVDDPSIPNRFLLFVGGDERSTDLPAHGWAADVVIAVDSGLHAAQRARVHVDHVVGDMDSVSDEALGAAADAGAEIHRHPADKDATDLELALDLVAELLACAGTGARLHVVGGGGGRLDHLLGDLMMLSGPRLAAWEVTARFGSASVSVVRPGRSVELRGRPGDQVSLLPVHGDAGGVCTSGVRWPLVDGYLTAGTSRAISNELETEVATVSISSGCLLALQPGTRGSVSTGRPGGYDPTPRAPAAQPNPGSERETRPEEDYR